MKKKGIFQLLHCIATTHLSDSCGINSRSHVRRAPQHAGIGNTCVGEVVTRSKKQNQAKRRDEGSN